MKAATTILSAEPYWTAADEAEQDVLVDELVRAVFKHRRDCETCQAGGPWCPQLADAFAALLDWRRHRRLVSEAAWLRANQTLRDFEAVL